MTILAGEQRVPARRILAVVTTGRYSSGAPVFEICRVLHSRGHTIDLACLEGWQHLAATYDFVRQVHVIGRDLTPEEDYELYRLFDASRLDDAEGRAGMFRNMAFFNSWWPETYSNLMTLCCDQRPDFIVGDCLADCCVDVMEQLQIPLAMVYPQMPIFMAPQKYIPGFPGLQAKHLTSEHASIWERLREEIFKYKILFAAKALIFQRRRFRVEAGLPKGGRPPPKPAYLLFVNSFFGVETPKDLPPLITPVGPVLADHYALLEESSELGQFLSTRSKVLYVAFGSHVNPPAWRVERLLRGFLAALETEHLDGVIWGMKNLEAVRKAFRSGSPGLQTSPDNMEEGATFDSILHHRDTRFKFMPWVPQRAVLDHPSVCIYLAHCGGSSTMEAVYHGVKVLAMSNHMDQFGNAKRLRQAGVAIELDKHKFTSDELHNDIQLLMDDTHGTFRDNVLRLQRLATVNSRRKHLAADMVEEVLYDHELRHQGTGSPGKGTHGKGTHDQVGPGDIGNKLRPMHLQTADSRMSWIKASNLDLWLVCGCAMVAAIYFPNLIWKMFR